VVLGHRKLRPQQQLPTTTCSTYTLSQNTSMQPCEMHPEEKAARRTAADTVLEHIERNRCTPFLYYKGTRGFHFSRTHHFASLIKACYRMLRVMLRSHASSSSLTALPGFACACFASALASALASAHALALALALDFTLASTLASALASALPPFSSLLVPRLSSRLYSLLCS
jgi:hypothetical protein